MRAPLLLCLFAAASARAQAPPSEAGPVAPVAQPAAEGFVVVRTNAPDAVLLDGAEVVGRAGEGPFALPPGVHRLLLREDAPERWDARTISTDVTVAAGETLAVVLDLPIRYRIESLPAGAEVAAEKADGTREALGTTPLVVDRPGGLAGALVASRAGYLDARVPAGDSLVNRHLLLLPPLRLDDEGRADWRPDERGPRAWLDVAAGALALAAGVVAVHYKFRADGFDDRYRDELSPEQGDPMLKAEAERLDGYSAVALGLSTASLGFLAIRLVLR